jgi:hypothetical protein
VNLGLDGLLSSLLGQGGGTSPGTSGPGVRPAGGPIDGAYITAAFDSMKPGQQDALLKRCRSILWTPANFDADLVQLCRILARFQ